MSDGILEKPQEPRSRKPGVKTLRSIMPYVLGSAVRYALGSRTYIVEETCEWVKICLPILDRSTLETMIQDIERQAPFGYGGHSDREEWMSLLQALRDERLLPEPVEEILETNDE